MEKKKLATVFDLFGTNSLAGEKIGPVLNCNGQKIQFKFSEHPNNRNGFWGAGAHYCEGTVYYRGGGQTGTHTWRELGKFGTTVGTCGLLNMGRLYSFFRNGSLAELARELFLEAMSHWYSALECYDSKLTYADTAKKEGWTVEFVGHNPRYGKSTGNPIYRFSRSLYTRDQKAYPKRVAKYKRAINDFSSNKTQPSVDERAPTKGHHKYGEFQQEKEEAKPVEKKPITVEDAVKSTFDLPF